MQLGRVVTLITALLFLTIPGQGQVSSKKASINKSNPFAVKMKQQKAATHLAKRQRFEAELTQLASRIRQGRQGTLTMSSRPHRSSANLLRLEQLNQGSLRINWTEDGTRPIFITGKLSEPLSLGKSTGQDALQAVAMQFLEDNKELLAINNPADEFHMSEISQDRYGQTHIRYKQVFDGLEIWGREARVHIGEDGMVNGFNGRYVATPQEISRVTEVFNSDQAVDLAGAEFGLTPDDIKAQKLIYIDETDKPHVVWSINLKKGLSQNWLYFVDVETGSLLKAYNRVMTDGPVAGSGTDLRGENRTINAYDIQGTFVMIDASKPMFDEGASTFPNDGRGVIYTLDAQNADSSLFFVTSNNVNSWNDPAAVSASANGALVYDFYRQQFNRDAIDGIGSTMLLVVNFNQNFNNAFWNGQLMVFGNGDGNDFSDLAGSLDVTAHEMSHGVIERTANLVYENQPGALNESFADVFGALFEFWVEGENGDWLIGEDVTTPSIGGDALRDMEDPASSKVAFGAQPTRMSEFRNLPNTPETDNGGVHINSGIPNRAFFLFATHPDVGIETAGEVYYHALTNYLTRNSQFIDCRLAVLRAVDDIFGAGTTGAQAAAAAAASAFDTVEILDSEGTPPPPVRPPVDGEEFLVVTDAQTGALYRYATDTGELTQLTNTLSVSRPTVTDDGSFILYVDDTNNVHLLAADGSLDETISTSGGFSNLSISPDGQFLAVTSTFVEANMYIFDLTDETGAGNKVIELYTPTTAEGTTAGTILYPDRIDWNGESDILMYDAFNIFVNASGDTTGYWDINLLRPDTEAITRLLPPQPLDINIGNPVFASNTDNIIAFDYIDAESNVSVLGLNVNEDQVGEITFNFNSLGSPTFSNDDSRVYYHFVNEGEQSVWVVDLNTDGISGVGNDQAILNGGIFPVDFAVGERPTSVEEPEQTVPATFALHANYPNPFNPETTIRFDVPEDARLSLKIYDVRGRMVRELLNEARPAGSHSAVWNGLDGEGRSVASGVYFYRLQILNQGGQPAVFTRKMTLLK